MYVIGKRSALLIVCLWLLLTALAAGQADLPSPRGHVNDFASVMAGSDAAFVENLASQLALDTGVELAVVTVNATEPLEPKEYAVRLFNAWGIGGPEDSGLLLLLALAEGRVEVEVGYGLEGSLPDGLVGAVLDQYAVPPLQQGQYSQGLRAAAEAFARSVQDEDFARTTAAAAQERFSPWITSFMAFVIIVLVLTRGSRRFPPGGGFGGRMPRSRRSLGPTGFPRGGSGSRGGFGGFGGGRSGGGGAGRSFK